MMLLKIFRNKKLKFLELKKIKLIIYHLEVLKILNKMIQSTILKILL